MGIKDLSNKEHHNLKTITALISETVFKCSILKFDIHRVVHRNIFL